MQSSFLAVSWHPHKTGGKLQFSAETFKPLWDLRLYSVIVSNVGNDSYSLGYCVIDCSSKMWMHFIDHLVPLDFELKHMWTAFIVWRCVFWLFSVLCKCPRVVCLFDCIYIVCNEEHHAVLFFAELWQKSMLWNWSTFKLCRAVFFGF